jgi:hypothetical protein
VHELQGALGWHTLLLPGVRKSDVVRGGEAMRRRHRYRFLAIDPETGVRERWDSMAYSREEARQALYDHGLTCIEEWHPTRVWKLDREALGRAIEHLGITDRVEVRYRYSRERRGRCRSWRGLHRIVVCPSQSTEEASRTLWHELQHAADYERQYRELGPAAALASDKERELPYACRPSEIRARRAEGYHDTVGPLAVDR